MKKFAAISFSIMLLVTFCFCAVALFDEQTISIEENRRLEELPILSPASYFSSEFMRRFEGFLSDHFPYRSEALALSRLFDRTKGYTGGVKLVAGNFEYEVYDFENLTGIAHTESNFSAYRTKIEKPVVVIEDDRIVSMFNFDEKTILDYADTLIAFKRALIEVSGDIRLFSLLAPSYAGVWHENYRDYSDPQGKAIEYTYELMQGDVETVDSFSELVRHRDEYIYFRTDHHWTHLGSYYAARAFARVAGVSSPSLTDFEPHRLDGFLGYQYRQHPSASLESNPDYIDYYMYGEENPSVKVFYYKKDEDGNPTDEIASFDSRVFTLSNVEERANYGIFMVGDYPVIVYEGTSAGDSCELNGRNLLIIKDSYANALSTWLTNSFDKIVIIDFRHFRGDIYDIVKHHGISDVLVVNYANVLYAPYLIQNLRDTMQSNRILEEEVK